jgi:shikimate kinase
MHIFLYGPSGSGKTTIGKLLAKSLGMPCVDLDAEIEQTTCTIQRYMENGKVLS